MMKFNLKNRPIRDPATTLTLEYEDALDEWFEGFEKELHEKIKNWPLNTKFHPALIEIKEILGE